MKHFEKFISYISSFDQSEESLRLVNDFIGQIENQHLDEDSPNLKKLLGILDIAMDYLSTYSTTLIAVLVIFNNDLDSRKLPNFISKIVEGYYKIKSLQDKKLGANTDDYMNYILTVAGDMRAVLIAIAENFYQLRNLNNQSRSKNQILQYSELIFIPLCHRLGFYRIKSEMEDLVLALRLPEIYSNISEKLNKTELQRNKIIADFMCPIKETLQNHKINYHIKSRTKSIASIYAKMQKQDIPFEKVYDLFAIRVVIDSLIKNEKADCWRVFSVVTNIYKHDIRRLRDWISKPRENGYESLHITVETAEKQFVEVQIRSQRMDDEAENGLAAHWRYKGGKGKTDIDFYLKKIRSAIENKESHSNFEAFSAENFTKDLFAFTPTGELKKLKSGATVLDFAFGIHSEIGVRCSGARVNGKIAPIKQKLNNGDMVEIITSKNQKPATDWLNFVISSRAKARIKKAVDEQRFNEAEQGKEILIRRMKNWKIDFSQDAIDKISKNVDTKNVTDIYRDIFLEKLDLAFIKKIFSEKEIKSEFVESAESIENKIKETKSIDSLVVDELTNVNYRLARCCNPIPGDAIFGFVTVAKGISIHRADCTNSISMHERYLYRILPAKWKNNEEKENFRAELFIKGFDKEGVVSDITKIISLNGNLISINLNTIGRNFQGKVVVLVHDSNQLTQLLKSLLNHHEVIEVFRKK
ncbi:MAG: hypothetical protein AUJ98_02210 [Bacteroidetes bacterium CG2_30_33_31]|nr:MAG: hypothetical protein AUJ98_02210 [Bacteroidetes bacterium CG2_30_33_31]